jgi:hypothetical protein
MGEALELGRGQAFELKIMPREWLFCFRAFFGCNLTSFLININRAKLLPS